MSEALLFKLEEVLDEAGWDRPARLYIIEGTEIEPTFTPFAEVSGHPCDVLQGMWQEGVRAHEGALGLALIVEGERHLRLEEFKERSPQGYETLRAVAVEEFGDNEDLVRTVVETAWLDMCAETSPLTMPESRRIHVRNSVAVLQTGWTIMVVRDQGGDPEALDPIPPDRLKASRVPDFMWQFLTGSEPVD